MGLTTTVSSPVEFGLRAIGIWPGASRSILYRTFWTISLGLAQTFQFRYIAGCIETANFLDLVDSVSTTLPYSLLCLKLVILWQNQKLFNEILTSMSRDWCNCGDVDFNMRTMTNKAILSHRCSLLIIGVYSLAVVMYVSVIMELNNIDNGSSKGEKQLFLKMKFPFVYEFSPVWEIVMFVQFLQLLSNASVIGMLDALIITLIFHTSGQIDIVCRGLLELFSKDCKYKSYKDAKSAIIRRHQSVIAFSDNIENLLSYIALMQFVTNTLVICGIAFVIVISIESGRGYAILLKSLFFYIAITLEAFIFCFAGEYLSNKSKSIANAAYETLWYNAKPSESRILLILILRSQKRLTLTIGKFNDLSLEVFANILKASASYVSVLLAMS
ncbi:PREDICTED: odorant receptor 4-like [Wasmannia auropunctata]|uniref:odorant receptor 4-like n=1 Tax=Wasmannia auropunctata TaxID=64793 RepID=UPI0005EEF52D|nr:PREDICTED: odorant receptor 4-like [Wasmannia auropunctata]